MRLLKSAREQALCWASWKNSQNNGELVHQRCWYLCQGWWGTSGSCPGTRESAGIPGPASCLCHHNCSYPKYPTKSNHGKNSSVFAMLQRLNLHELNVFLMLCTEQWSPGLSPAWPVYPLQRTSTLHRLMQLSPSKQSWTPSSPSHLPHLLWAFLLLPCPVGTPTNSDHSTLSHLFNFFSFSLSRFLRVLIFITQLTGSLPPNPIIHQIKDT